MPAARPINRTGRSRRGGTTRIPNARAAIVGSVYTASNGRVPGRWDFGRTCFGRITGPGEAVGRGGAAFEARARRTRATAIGSSVEDADLTYSPSFWSSVSSWGLQIPSSRASSWTRILRRCGPPLGGRRLDVVISAPLLSIVDHPSLGARLGTCRLPLVDVRQTLPTVVGLSCRRLVVRDLDSGNVVRS